MSFNQSAPSSSSANQPHQASSRPLTREERDQLDELEDRVRHLPTASQVIAFLEAVERENPVVAQQLMVVLQSTYNSGEYQYRPESGSVGENGALFNIIRTTGNQHPNWNPDPTDPNKGVGPGSPASASEIVYLEKVHTMYHNAGSR